MTRDEIRTQISGALTSVAPEIDPVSLMPSAPLRDQVDLDSMDFLRFVMELHRRLGVDVPEADYQKLSTLNDVIDYVTAHRGASAAMPSRAAERLE
jgi:acyl carrier protein